MLWAMLTLLSLNCSVLLYGGAGGFGVETETTPSLFRGLSEYFEKLDELPLWPSYLRLEIKLYKGENLYLVVGQAGSMACHQVG